MEGLNNGFIEFLEDMEQTLKPQPVISQKWVRVTDKQLHLVDVNDEKQAILFEFISSFNSFRNNDTYKALQDAYESDSVFRSASIAAGHWGTLDGLLPGIIGKCGCLSDGSVSFDRNCVKQFLNRIREALQSNSQKFSAHARIFGITPTVKCFTFDKGLELYRLNRIEMNQRQGFINPFTSVSYESQWALYHPAEIRYTFDLEIDPNDDGVFFSAMQRARVKAREVINTVLNSFLIAAGGLISLGQIQIETAVMVPVAVSSLYSDLPLPHVRKVTKQNLRKVKTIFDLLSKPPKRDRTLPRSLHRFILAQKRQEDIDRLVDLVIAWEALLLTNEGNPIFQELSYRFALNAASLLFTQTKSDDRERIFEKFKVAYNARSVILHGGSEKSIEKALASGGFNNVQGLINYLAFNYREILFRLIDIPVDSRPYLDVGGWHKLIWDY
jgi:hypothetical protein